MNALRLFALSALVLAATGSAPASAAECPLRPSGARAAWCTEGLAGGLIPIARTGNELNKRLPTEYRVCIADKVAPGSTVTVFHEPGPGGANGRSTLTEKEPCGCFIAPLLQVQYAGPVGHPQNFNIGGTYQAYLSGHCKTSIAPVKVGKAKGIVAQCRDAGAGSECQVPLPAGKHRNYRLCFAPGFVADPNNAGRITLRANNYIPGLIPYDPLDPDITVSCMDVYAADTLKVALGIRLDVNRTVKLHLQTINATEPK